MNFRCSLLTFLQLLVVPNTCDEENTSVKFTVKPPLVDEMDG